MSDDVFPLFEDFLDELEEQGRRDRTLTARELQTRQFTEWCQAEGTESATEVDQDAVTNWVDHLRKEGYAKKTIMCKYGGVSAAYNKLYEMEEIDHNPVDRLKRETIERKAEKGRRKEIKKREQQSKDYLEKETVYELAEEHAPEPTDRNELIIKLLFWTGARVHELLGIELGRDGSLDGRGSDIDPSEPSIEVFDQKTSEMRTVSYPRQEINPLLRDWVRHGRLRYKQAMDTQALFVGKRGDLSKSRLTEIVDEAAQNAGIQEVDRQTVDGNERKRVTPHLLRHSHGMYYHNEEDVPTDTIKDHLGHESVETTEDFYVENTREKIIDTFGE